MPLDPVFEEMLKQMAEAGAPALIDLPPAEGRALYRAMNETMPQVELLSVTDKSIPVHEGEIGIRIYRQSDDSAQPCLVFYHGGGWVIGDLETHDSVCRQLCREAACTVIAVDYRLAPEFPFPTPVNDCYSALKWVHDHASELSIDPKRLAVGGDSAGGNLSACMALKAREEGLVLAHQLLIYPVTDTGFDTPSYKENAEGYMLTLESMQWFWNHYLSADPEGLKNPMAAPMRASSHDGLAPATVITAEFDPLRDEGEAYGQKLLDAGVPTRIQRYDGMIHGFFGMTHIVQGARDAMQLAVSQLQSAFS